MSKSSYFVALGLALTSSYASAAELYWADSGTGKVQRVQSDGNQVEDLPTNIAFPTSVALISNGDQLYVGSNKDFGTIYRGTLNGDHMQAVVAPAYNVTTLAVDAEHGKLYWGDQGTEHILRSNLDGSAEETIVIGLDGPRGIAIDVASGLLFWSENGSLSRSSLDGTDRRSIVTGILPVQLALDSELQKIYWTDAGGTIERANWDGSFPETVLRTTTNEPDLLSGLGIALDVAGGKVYWSEGPILDTSGRIRRANLDGSNIEDLVSTGLISPTSLVFVPEPSAFVLMAAAGIILLGRFLGGSKMVRFVALVTLLLAFPSAHQAATFESIGGLVDEDGISSGLPAAVSADGSVVVGHSSSAELDEEAFRWTRSGGMVGLGALPMFDTESGAGGISADGTTVVGWSKHEGGGPYSQAFLWRNATGMIGLGHLSQETLGGDSISSGAADVSADGTVVVGSSTTQSGEEAFRWTATTGMVGLGPQTGNARAVSNDGRVIVGDAADGSGFFRWTSSTGAVFFGNDSVALDISGDGSVIVGRKGQEAFLWTEASGFKGLGDLPGGNLYSEAESTSEDGSVIVGLASTDVGVRPFIWDVINGMRDLEDVLETEHGLDLSAWSLDAPVHVSDDGRSFVSIGQGPSGDLEGWIATVPEPPGFIIAFVGLATLVSFGLGLTVVRYFCTVRLTAR